MNGYGGGFGNAFGGDGSWWILLLFILLGGWGNGYGGGYGGNELYPWMNQSEQVSGGFRDQMLNSNISAIQSGVNDISSQLCSGFGGVQQSLCNGFAGVNATLNSGFAGVESNANTRQIANMQNLFGMQTAMTGGFNNLATLQATNASNTLAGLKDVQYTVATENCADRYEAAQNTRDIIENCNRNNQAILDKLCQLELDGVKAQVDAKNDRISELQTQLNMANLAASQTAQTAAIQAGQVAEVDALYNRLSSCPVPSMPVYGSQPIFTCGGNNYGCGCGSF